MAKRKTVAALALISVNGNKALVSTKGSEVAPGSKWKEWKIKWGDGEEIGGNAKPSENISHDYPVIPIDPAFPNETTDKYDIVFEIKDSKGGSSFAVVDNVIITRNPLVPPIVEVNITLLSPNSGPVGSTVTVMGTSFGSIQGTSTITLNGTTMIVNSWSDTQIVAVIPNEISGQIVVTRTGFGDGNAFFQVTQVQTFDRFISITGNDTWNGQFPDNSQGGNNGPWRTFNFARTQVTAGMSVGVRGGTYVENLSWIGGGPIGALGNYITFSYYNGEQVSIVPSGGDFVLDCRGATANDTNAPRYIEFIGIHFDGSHVANNTVKITAWDATVVPALAPSHHIRFIRCRLSADYGLDPHGDQHFSSSGILVTWESVGVELIQCELDHMGGFSQTNNNYGSAVYGAGSDLTVDGCHIHSIGGYGISNISSQPNQVVLNHIITKNRITNCGQAGINQLGGINLGEGTGHIIANNLCYNNLVGPGIILSVFTGVPSSTGIKIFNNTCFNNFIGYKIDSGQGQSIVRNNIGYQNSGGNFIDIGSGTVKDHNLTDGTNPQFVDTTNFRLQSSSPCRNTGTNADTIPTDVPNDFHGIIRPQEAVYDIGATEFVP